MAKARFTIRTGLLWLTVAAIFSIALRGAALNEAWAVGVAAAVASVALLIAVHAALYGASQVLAGRGASAARDSVRERGAPR
ncbi:MAG: hypothetical protein ACRCT8_02980 [Lacipirellulaceae bacterium]